MFLAISAVVALLAGCGGSTSRSGASDRFQFTDATTKGEVIAAEQRRPPGVVTGPLLDGSGAYTLSSDLGKVVVINLWGSWCGPCQVETPRFQQVYEQVRDQGVNFVGFAVKENGESGPRTFVRDKAITYPIVYDPPAKVALQLGRIPVSGIPLTVLIDTQGRVGAVYIGLVQPSQLKPAIAALLGEIEPPVTPPTNPTASTPSPAATR